MLSRTLQLAHSIRVPLFVALASLIGESASHARQSTTLTGPIQLAWQSSVDGALPTDAWANDIAVRGTLVFATGVRSHFGNDIRTVAYDRTNGLVWESIYAGGGAGIDEGISIAVDPTGTRVFVAGSAVQAGLLQPQGIVIAYDANTGAQLWTRVFAGTGALNSHAGLVAGLACAADGQSLFIAASETPTFSPTVPTPPFFGTTYARLSALDGSSIWQTTNTNGSPVQTARDLELSPDGARLYTVGASFSGNIYSGIKSHFQLDARSAATGASAWTRSLESNVAGVQGGRGVAVSADSSRIAIVGSGANGRVGVYDTAGTLLSSDSVAGWTPRHAAFAGATAQLIVAGETSSAQRVRAYDGAGALQWNTDAGATGATRDLIVEPSQQAVFALAQQGATQTEEGSWLTWRLELATGAIGWQAGSGAGDSKPDLAGALALDPLQQDLLAAGGRANSGQLKALAFEARSFVGGAVVGGAMLAESASADQLIADRVTSADGSRVYVIGSHATASSTSQRGLVAALSTQDGSVAWSLDVQAPEQAPIANAIASGTAVALDAAANRLYAGGRYGVAQHYVARIDATSGALTWLASADVAPGSAEWVRDLAVADNGAHVHVATSTVSKFRVDTRSAQDGSMLWNWTSDVYDGNYSPRLEVSPDGSRLHAIGTNYVSLGSFEDPYVTTFDAASGAVLWSKLFDFTGAQEAWDHDGASCTAMSADGATLYIGGRSQANAAFDYSLWALAIDAATGTQLWHAEHVDPSWDVAEAVRIAASPDGSRVFLFGRTWKTLLPVGNQADDAVYAFRASDGLPQWSFLPTDNVWSEPRDLAVARDSASLVVASSLGAGVGPMDATFAGLDASSGAVIWSATVSAANGLDDRGRAIALTPDGARAVLLAESTVPGQQRDWLALGVDLPKLWAAPASISLAQGGTQTFDLSAGAAHAGQLALLVGSVSGTAPGIPIDGWLVPLVLDPYLLYTVSQPNQPPLAGSLGLLDANGHREAVFQLAAGSDPALAGVTVHHAYIALQGVQVVLASSPVALALVP